VDANKPDEANAGPKEPQQRRSFARHERESERKSLLGALVEVERQAGHLRTWIASHELFMAEGDGELSRMLQWARGELAALEKATEPAPLAEVLRRRNLLPEVDELLNPPGDSFRGQR
jgi:hypothetical protein